MDVIIFGGQSNMQGGSYVLPKNNEPVFGAVEYKWNEKCVEPLCHPVGEDFSTYILAAAKGGGSLIPDFCKIYIKESGREIFAIPAACGNTTVGQWLYGTQRYHYAKQKIRDGISYARSMGTVDHITRISLIDEYQNFDALGHFNNKGYEIIGREAGPALAEYVKGL